MPPSVLSRKIVEQGIYPAVDPLESSSRILEADVVGEEHYETARKVQEYLQKYKELQDIIAILGMEECLKRQESKLPSPERCKSSFPSLSMWQKSSPVFRVNMYR